MTESSGWELFRSSSVFRRIAWLTVRTRSSCQDSSTVTTHLFNSLSRDLGEGLALWDWLGDFKWPYNVTINQDESVAAALLSELEACRAGTTAVLDHHYACTDVETTLAVAQALEQVGIRGRVGRGLVSPITEGARIQGLGEELFRYPISDELDMMRVCMEERPPGALVEVWPAPLEIIYTPFDLIHGAVGLAEEFGTGWHARYSEASGDPGLFEAAHGLRPVSWLYEQGPLRQGATLAHAIWLDDDQVAQLGETQTGASHNSVCKIVHEFRGFPAEGPSRCRCSCRARDRLRQRRPQTGSVRTDEAVHLAATSAHDGSDRDGCSYGS